MAHAFRLFKLRDELMRLAYSILYPEKLERITSYIRESEVFKEKFESKEIKGKSVIDDVRDVFSRVCSSITLSSPGFFELQNRLMVKKGENTPFIKLRFEIPEKVKTTAAEWRSYANEIFVIFINMYGAQMIKSPYEEIFGPTNSYETRYLEAEINIGGLDIKVELISDKELMKQTASVSDIFTPLRESEISPNISSRQYFALEHLTELRKNFKEAQRLGDLSAFFESVGGSKVISIEGISRGIYFPEDATILDVLYAHLGPDAFQVHRVHVREKKGQIRIIECSGNNNGANQILGNGARIVEIKKLGNTLTSTNRDIHLLSLLGCANLHSVRLALADTVESEILSEKIKREALVRKGYELLMWQYRLAWEEQQNRNNIIESKSFFEIPLDVIPYQAKPLYQNVSDLLYDIGLGRIGKDELDDVIGYLTERRGEAVFLEIEEREDNGEDLGKKVLDALAENNIEYWQIKIQNRLSPAGKLVQRLYIWFHEDQLGGDDVNISRTNRLEHIISKIDSGGKCFVSVDWKNYDMAELSKL